MKKKNKRIISLLASLAMMSAMGAMTVSAEDYDPADHDPEEMWCRLHRCFDGCHSLHDVDLKAEMVDTDNYRSYILRKAAEQMLSQAKLGTPQSVLLLLDDGHPITTTITISPTTNPTTKFPLPALTVTPNNPSPEIIKNFEKLSLKISEPDNSFSFEDCTTKPGVPISIVQ